MSESENNIQNCHPKKRFIESSSFYTNCDSSNPFSGMKICDSNFLDEVPQRSTCPRCNRSRKYYCYTCYIAVQEVASRLPIVNLPVKIDIIKHPKEVDGKSTSAHAAVLAPNDVTIYTYPNFPSYEKEKVLLIFPGKSAVPFEEWWLSNIAEPFSPQSNAESTASSHVDSGLPFNKVIFIDSTWRQSKALYMDPRLNKLPCVVLSSYKSLFWRYARRKHESHLSTIEAVYYFLMELREALLPEHPYDGEFDDLLFFFKFMYFKIRSLYDPVTLKAYADTLVHHSAEGT